MSNIGKEITDFYCNGFFGRVYDMTGAIILAEGESWIVVRLDSGEVRFTSFQDVNSEGTVTNFDKQKYIDAWCS